MRVTKCRHKSDSTPVGLSKVNPEDLRWDILRQVWSKNLYNVKRLCSFLLPRVITSWVIFFLFFFLFRSVGQSASVQLFRRINFNRPHTMKKKNLLSFSVIRVVFTVSKSVVLHNYVNVAERDRGENASISRKTKNHRTSLRKTPLNKRQKNKLIFKTIPIWSTVLKKTKNCSWNHESAIL